MLETGVKSDPAFCLGQFIEKTVAVGHRDLSQMASCQVWLSIAGV